MVLYHKTREQLNCQGRDDSFASGGDVSESVLFTSDDRTNRQIICSNEAVAPVSRVEGGAELKALSLLVCICSSSHSVMVQIMIPKLAQPEE